MWLSGTRQLPGRALQTEPEPGLRARPTHFLISLLLLSVTGPRCCYCLSQPQLVLLRVKFPAHGTAWTTQAKEEDPDSHQLLPGISPDNGCPFSGGVWPITQWLAQEPSVAPSVYGTTLLLGSDFSEGSSFSPFPQCSLY